MAIKITQVIGDTKTCSRCGLFKKFSEFSANRFLACGLQSHCKKCKAEALAVRRQNADYKKLLRASAQRNQHKTRARRRANRIADMLEQAKARAKRRCVPFELVRADIVIPECCPVFGTPFVRGADGNPVADGRFSEWSPSLDCIVPSRGYVRGNIQVISHKANSMKGNASLEQLEDFARWALRLRNRANGSQAAA